LGLVGFWVVFCGWFVVFVFGCGFCVCFLWWWWFCFWLFMALLWLFFFGAGSWLVFVFRAVNRLLIVFIYPLLFACCALHIASKFFSPFSFFAFFLSAVCEQQSCHITAFCVYVVGWILFVVNWVLLLLYCVYFIAVVVVRYCIL
jgi:hypothetical protein